MLELAGLTGHRDSRVATLSGGMQRRLNLAVALVHKPRLLLLDEPTAGVDTHSRQHVFETIRNLRDCGNAILYTTHQMQEAEGLCDRLGIMDKGRMVAVGTLSALMKAANCAETIEIRGLDACVDLSVIRSLNGVAAVEACDGIVGLSVENAAALLQPLHQLVNCSKQRVYIKVMPPSLEQYFLRLTGKELRD
jgi:ABC-2 type transport system ATP-binding protein